MPPPPERVLAVPHLCLRLRLINGLPSPIIQLPLKLFFFHCVPGQASQCTGLSVISFPSLDHHSGSGIPIITMSLSILPSSMWCLYCLCAKAVPSALDSSSGGTAAYVGFDLVCPWKEVSSRSSYSAISVTASKCLGLLELNV